jgi:hypothetical protein
MHSKTLTIVLVIVLITSLLGPLGWSAGAEPPPLEEQIEQAIVDGLAWLADQQHEDGYWEDWGSCERVAVTGLVVTKLSEYAFETGSSPSDPEYEYAGEIAAGVAYILANRSEQTIGVQPAGDPDGDGDGIGVYYGQPCSHPMYNTSIAVMALAAATDPGLAAELQDATDFLAWAQVDPGCGVHQGGWRYGGNDCSSDQSNSGYVTLGLGYAEAYGIPIPGFVKSELDLWIDEIQNPDGGSDYDPEYRWGSSLLRTGNLLFEMSLVGDPITESRVQDAIGYIEDHWQERACSQEHYTLMKGLEAYDIRMLDLDDDGIPEHDWFAEVAQELVDTQQDGHWPDDCWGGGVLSAVWNLLVLERAIPNRPPNCEDAYPSVETIWPPNHKFVPVEVLGVVDPDEDELTITILGIYQDEPVDTYGDGKFTPDGIIAEDKASCEVRAERSGTKKVPGDGRVYHIRFLAEDGRGGECVGKVRVCVPHDQSGDPCIDSGPPYYDSTATAP